MRARDVVGDRFEVIAFHRAGGMGEVFRARDRVTGAEVALKLVRHAEGNAEKRFAREVSILAQLKDPGIVEYVAHGDAPDGRSFLAMEWLDGEDLGERMSRAPLSPAEAVGMALCVARALAAAHASGIVHRDLKPQNVFLLGGMPRRAKLLDFGLARTAKPVPEITKTGMTVGTRGYMAPEQALGEKNVGEKSDLFSLGCVIYEALMGRSAFYAKDPDEVLRKIVFEDVTPLIDLMADVPTKLSAVVDAMLAKEPSDRPRDAATVVATLEAIERELLVEGWVAIVIEGPDAGRRVIVSALPLDIGKHPRATLALSDGAASRFHCELCVDGQRVVVRDLNSTNGLTLDGAKIDVAPIRDGAILGVGRSRIEVRRELVACEPTPLERASAEDTHLLVRAERDAAIHVARTIHDASARRRGPFVVLAGDGYREADVIAASGGTAVVHDVDRLSLADQDALTQLLERRSVRVNGALRLVDTRVVASTSIDLRLAVNRGELRAALYASLGRVRLTA